MWSVSEKLGKVASLGSYRAFKDRRQQRKRVGEEKHLNICWKILTWLVQLSSARATAEELAGVATL